MASMGARVAVVDDDKDVRELVGAALTDAGYEVITSTNGLRLLSTLHVDRPDLILLDVMMSWIDGVELCRAIKQNTSLREIPVVFMSGRTTEADVARGMAAGAEDYLPKPLDMEHLLTRVGQIVGKPVGKP
jgi:DNA-binding response OmpR family regulator